MNGLMRWLVAIGASLLPAIAGAAQVTTIADFTGACGSILVCAGAAAEQGAALRLVPAAREQSGAATLAAPLSLAPGQGFVTSFSFRLTGGSAGPYADGLAFLLARDPAGLGAAGRYGNSMGFEGVADSIAVEFDVFDNGNEPGGSNHVALDLGGITSNIAAASPYGQSSCNTIAGPGCMANGDTWTAIIGYNAIDQALSVAVRDGDGNTDLLIDRHAVDLPAALGGTLAYAGFGAGTGDFFMNHDLLSWTIATANPTLDLQNPEAWLAAALATQQAQTGIPEPDSAPMLAMGMILLAGLASWRG